MHLQKLGCILFVCILEVLEGSPLFDTTLHVKKYLTEEPGFDLSPEQIKKHKIWDKGMVPYYIDTVSYDKPLRDDIRTKLHETGEITGISFIELDAPPIDESKIRWVMFINRVNELECDEHNITGQGLERIILGYDCLARGVAVPKAVLAILNIPPQHNSPHRNDFIEVLFENILPDKKQYFNALKNEDWLFHDIKYDFFSIGHYPHFQYSANGGYTIRPKNYTQELFVGERTTYSEHDIWKITMLYNYIISKSKLPSGNCNKLFKPGDNYFKIKHDETALQQPRKLPNAYLGLPPDEEKLQQYEDSLQNESEKDLTGYDAVSSENIQKLNENDIKDEREISDNEEIIKTSLEIKKSTKTSSELKEITKTSSELKELTKTSSELKELTKTSSELKELTKTSSELKPAVERTYDDSAFDS